MSRNLFADNSICYALREPTADQLKKDPWGINRDRVFVVVSLEDLIQAAKSKIPEPYKKFTQYTTGLSDHAVYLYIPMAELDKNMDQLREDEYVRGIEFHIKEQKWELEIFLKDFHTIIALSWSIK